MREPNSALVELDDVRLERGAKACLTVDSRRCFRDVDRGVCMRRCREQELAALRRQCEQPSVDEVVQRLGMRKGCAPSTETPLRCKVRTISRA